MPKYIVTCKDDLVIKGWNCNQPLSIEQLNCCSTCQNYSKEDEYCAGTKFFGRVVARYMSPNDYCSKWQPKENAEV